MGGGGGGLQSEDFKWPVYVISFISLYTKSGLHRTVESGNCTYKCINFAFFKLLNKKECLIYDCNRYYFLPSFLN